MATLNAQAPAALGGGGAGGRTGGGATGGMQVCKDWPRMQVENEFIRGTAW